MRERLYGDGRADKVVREASRVPGRAVYEVNGLGLGESLVAQASRRAGLPRVLAPDVVGFGMPDAMPAIVVATSAPATIS